MKRTLADLAVLCLLLTMVPLAQAAAAEAKPADEAASAPKPKAHATRKVPYLGIGVKPVAPETAAQVNLPAGAGLAVTVVADQSPASKAGLKTHDILHKVDDQILFNGEQFRSLIRSHKNGDDVQLTVIRQSKPLQITATLGEQTVPLNPLPAAGNFPRPRVFQWQGGQPLPDMDIPEELKKQFEDLRKRAEGLPDLKQWQHQWPNQGNFRDMQERMQRQMEQMRKQFDLAPGEQFQHHMTASAAFSDGTHTLNLKVSPDQGKHLVAKNAEGKEVFNGPVNTPQERKAVPEAIRPKLERLEKQTNFNFKFKGQRPRENKNVA